MTWVVADLETDNLLPKVTKVHCAVSIDDKGHQETAIGDHAVGELMESLSSYDYIVGHNWQGYDDKVLDKLGIKKPDAVVRDTCVMSRLIWPDIKFRDADLRKKDPSFPLGSTFRHPHSLESWGYRLGDLKGDYGKTTDWSEFSQEMLDYCVQDVKLTVKLWELEQSKGFSEKSIELEHKFAAVLGDMEQRGVHFDSKAAQSLYAELASQRQELEAELLTIFPPRIVHYETPKKKLKRTKEIPFNPGSRQQIAYNLKLKYGWKPEKFTPSGRALLDESVLPKLPYPEAKRFFRKLYIDKKISQVAEGKQAWLKKVRDDGRLEQRINHNGAVSGRCTHRVIVNVPRPDKEFGPEMRACFAAAPGMVLVGADASQLELRCLAHFLFPYDDGAYADTVLHGDIHTANQEAAGLNTRDDAKTFIYALNYGAGDAKLGTLVLPDTQDESRLRKAGKAIRNRFMAKVPAFKSFLKAVKAEAESGTLVGLDGRLLHVRSLHSALNTKLQGAGAVAIKQATTVAHLTLGDRARMVLHSHDEYQWETTPEQADGVGKDLTNAFYLAGVMLGFKCALAGEYKVGRNWAETH